MITIKLKIIEDISKELFPFKKKWNNIYRYAFNRFIDSKNMSQFDSYSIMNNMNNVDEIDVSWKRQAFSQAYALYKAIKKQGNNSLIFGGKFNFLKLKKGLISKEEFNKLKDIKISMEGSKCDPNGNRKFKFDVEKMECKVKLIDQLTFHIENSSKRNMELLKLLSIKSKNHEIPVTYGLDEEYLYITFDEKKLGCNLNYLPIKDRILSIDSNPNYIGYSIVENEKILYKEVLDLSKVKFNRNKKMFELSQIAKYINSIALHFRVEMIGIEKLNITSRDHKKGNVYNRTVNNDWSRNYFFNLIRKNSNISNIKIQEIAAQYSSTIGCVMNPSEVDSIAASLELNRRLLIFKKIYIDKTMKKEDVIFPKWDVESLPTHWKKMVNEYNILNWVELHNLIKKTKTSYRFLYKDFVKSQKVLRFKSRQSLVDKCLCFI